MPKLRIMKDDLYAALDDQKTTELHVEPWKHGWTQWHVLCIKGTWWKFAVNHHPYEGMDRDMPWADAVAVRVELVQKGEWTIIPD